MEANFTAATSCQILDDDISVMVFFFCVVCALLGGLLNSFALLVTASKPDLRNHVHCWFIISLMLSDLVYSVLNLPTTAASLLKRYPVFDVDVTCHWLTVVSNANLAISMTSQAFTAVCRMKGAHSKTVLISITKPLRVAAITSSIWAVSFAVMLLPVFKIWVEMVYEPMLMKCVIRPITLVPLWNAAIAAGILLPFVVIVVSYASIFHRVRTTDIQVLKFSDGNLLLRAQQRKKQVRIGKVSILICLNFAVGFFPILTTLNRIPVTCHSGDLYMVASLLQWTRVIADPLIYFYFTKKARKASKKFLLEIFSR